MAIMRERTSVPPASPLPTLGFPTLPLRLPDDEREVQKVGVDTNDGSRDIQRRNHQSSFSALDASYQPVSVGRKKKKKEGFRSIGKPEGGWREARGPVDGRCGDM